MVEACPGLRYVLVVGGDQVTPDFGVGVTTAAYGAAVTSARKAFSPENGRSGDDKLLIYTGSTTGLPKGVLWRHEDFYWSALAGGNHYGEPRRSVEEVVAAAVAMPAGGYLLTGWLCRRLSAWWTSHCAGVPDERFGERVAAVVSLREGGQGSGEALREHCRGMLAGYKVPVRIEFVPELVRSPTGKADYRWAREVLAGG